MEIECIKESAFNKEKSFKIAFNEILKINNPTILEIGSTIEEVESGAENSSPLFAWFVKKYGGCFITCDIVPEHTNLCQKLIMRYRIGNNINCVTMDGLEYIQTWPDESLDMIYLDSMNANPDDYRKAALHNLYLCKVAINKIKPNGIIIIDDVFDIDTYEGKGLLVIPYLIKKNFKCLFKGNQFVFKNIKEELNE